MTGTLNNTDVETWMRRLRRGSRIACALGAIVCLVLANVTPSSFWPAYLVSWLFLLGIGLGCLGLTLLHQLTGGQWGLEIVRHLVASAATLPAAALLALPLGIGLHRIYVWFDLGRAHEVLNRHQQLYFASWAWALRLFIYLGIWAVLSRVVVSRYRQICRNRDLHPWFATPRASAVGLIGVSLTATFAMIDWVMSLEPKWTSTIFAAMLSMGFVVSAMAFVLLVRQLPFPQAELPADAKPARDRAFDLGNLLMAALLMWVYFAASQFLIIWSGDLPIETAWYQRRLEGIWPGFALALVLLHFALPFACLLSRDMKTNRNAMMFVTVELLAMRMVDLVWSVIPACATEEMLWLFCLPVTFVTLGSAWLSVFMRYQERLPRLIVDSVATPPATSMEVAST